MLEAEKIAAQLDAIGQLIYQAEVEGKAAASLPVPRAALVVGPERAPAFSAPENPGVDGPVTDVAEIVNAHEGSASAPIGASTLELRRSPVRGLILPPHLLRTQW